MKALAVVAILLLNVPALAKNLHQATVLDSHNEIATGGLCMWHSCMTTYATLSMGGHKYSVWGMQMKAKPELHPGDLLTIDYKKPPDLWIVTNSKCYRFWIKQVD